MWGTIASILGSLLSQNQNGGDELAQGMAGLQQGVNQFQPTGNYDIQQKPDFGGQQSSMFGGTRNLDSETQKVMERLAQRYGGGM